MPDLFPAFAAQVERTLRRMTEKDEAFVTSTKPDALYAAYLAAFPEGSNPLFRKRTEHDCSCCRQFIRRAGGIVTVRDGALCTVWDEAAEYAPYPYREVATALRDLLRAAPIEALYRVSKSETGYGAKQSLSTVTAGEGASKKTEVIRWNHLYTGELAKSLCVDDASGVVAAHRDTVHVFRRGLTELAPGAVVAVLELIDSNSLYRGEEFRRIVQTFQTAQQTYLKLPPAARLTFPWVNATERFRGTAIGSLVEDLSDAVVVVDTQGKSHRYHPERLLQTEGGAVRASELAARWGAGLRTHTMVESVHNGTDWDKVELYQITNIHIALPLDDLEAAVKSYEAKVAPGNYKRPKPLVTPAMVEAALKTLVDLGLEPALERRLARVEDVAVTDVQWVSRDVRPALKNSKVVDILSKHVTKTPPKPPTGDEAQETIGLDDFVATVLPDATDVEIMLEARHMCNLVALTAPAQPESRQLFRWGNDFGWSYTGNTADSDLRRTVQERGGRVDGVFRFSHSWNHPGRRNASLMDLHVFMPAHPVRVSAPGTINDHYGGAGRFSSERVGWNHRNHPESGGTQDVDYTAEAPIDFVPVENITFPDITRMPEGVYVCKVHNWQWRAPTTGGFQAEIECGGHVYEYTYPTALSNKEWVTVASVTLRGGRFTVEHHIPCGNVQQEKWGLTTLTYVKVKMVTRSPNYWGDRGVGNRHTFFFLEGARPDAPVRGFYNEFLDARLDGHKRVFELLADKMQCQPVEDGLAGVGFSSTQPGSFIARVRQGTRRRVFNVNVTVGV